jgi:hypothetical protein
MIDGRNNLNVNLNWKCAPQLDEVNGLHNIQAVLDRRR